MNQTIGYMFFRFSDRILQKPNAMCGDYGDHWLNLQAKTRSGMADSHTMLGPTWAQQGAQKNLGIILGGLVWEGWKLERKYCKITIINSRCCILHYRIAIVNGKRWNYIKATSWMGSADSTKNHVNFTQCFSNPQAELHCLGWGIHFVLFRAGFLFSNCLGHIFIISEMPTKIDKIFIRRFVIISLWASFSFS